MIDKNKKTRLTIKQARRALGMIARNYTDEQVAEVLDAMRAIAELAYGEIEGKDDN